MMFWWDNKDFTDTGGIGEDEISLRINLNSVYGNFILVLMGVTFCELV